jgi:hypothetical protein
MTSSVIPRAAAGAAFPAIIRALRAPASSRALAVMQRRLLHAAHRVERLSRNSRAARAGATSIGPTRLRSPASSPRRAERCRRRPRRCVLCQRSPKLTCPASEGRDRQDGGAQRHGQYPGKARGCAPADPDRAVAVDQGAVERDLPLGSGVPGGAQVNGAPGREHEVRFPMAGYVGDDRSRASSDVPLHGVVFGIAALLEKTARSQAERASSLPSSRQASAVASGLRSGDLSCGARRRF